MTKRAWAPLTLGAAAVGVLLFTSGCLPMATTVSGDAVHRDEHTQIAVVFSDHDRGIIRDYYGRRRSGLPPGLAKKEQLPPGLQKQVQRNGHLPPGLEGERLPSDLEKQLDTLPADYVRLRVGADIVLMNGRTRIVVDLIKDIAL
jgi:hypothetical protein